MRHAWVPTAGLLVAFLIAPARGGDWPQVLGPNRNGIAAADERLAETWPAEGPPVEWRREVGAGYAGIAVAGGRAVLFSRVGDREVVEGIDAATGKTLWSDGHPTTFAPQVGGGNGPLCTPVIHGGRVIVCGAQGVLACLDVATGKRLWQRDTHREFDAPEGYFGAGSTPLVVGDHVLVNVGGSRQEAGIVAFDLGTGATAWKATAEPASYSAPVAVDIAGVAHALFVTRYQCLLVEAATGTVKWKFPFGMRGPTVNAATPLVMAGDAADKRLLVTAAYGIGSVYASFDGKAAQTLWEGTDSLATQYCTPIVTQGILVAIDGRDDMPPADLKAVEAATGRVLWTERGFDYGTLLSADGKLLAAKTDGELALMRADAAGMKVLARARPLAGTIRALPALAAGRLYVRDDAVLICLRVGR
ncbi:MAG: PQQ-binding-like beta-propeller repeat protein [Planctomycetia bacterium]|jgi:outer membrane protein assembly factor BamB